MTTEQRLERLEKRGGTARVATIVFALLLSACVSSDYVRVGSTTYPPRPRGFPIAVFMDASAPVAVQKSLGDTVQDTASIPPHETIGRVDVSGAPDATWVAVAEEGERRARELGGDAILVGGSGTPITGVVSQTNPYGTGYGRAIRGKQLVLWIVRYEDQSQAQVLLEMIAACENVFWVAPR